MTCTEVLACLHEFSDGAVTDPTAVEAITAHLAGCRGCRVARERVRALEAL
ncbi:MAG: zf-HC2 domain-containing protein, partial [Planctomycetes bacterium]|nr:zf-HC2 domain-containing protein [Planctomycetota bacterium]